MCAGLLLSLNPSMEHIELTKREVVFGRNAKCDIVFDDLQVSKQHCKVRVGERKRVRVCVQWRQTDLAVVVVCSSCAQQTVCLYKT